jgi:hypothetical protein
MKCRCNFWVNRGFHGNFPRPNSPTMSCSEYAAAIRLFSHTFLACAFLSFGTLQLSAQGPGPDGDLLFTIQHPDAEPGDAFAQSFDSYTGGLNVSIYAVGAPIDDIGGNEAEGSVNVYEASTGLVLVATLTAPDGQPYSKFGTAVAIGDAGDVIAVGAPGPSDGENGGVDFSGKVYLYHNAYDGTGWNFLTVISGTDDEDFGAALDFAGLWLAVGAPHATDAHDSQGAVYLIKQDGDCIFGLEQTIYADDAHADADFGAALSLYDGRLMVGDPQNNEEADAAGAVYSYEIDLDGLAFVATGKQTATDAHANAHLGASVSDALDGYFIAGAPGADGTGAAYEFYVEDGNYENRIQPCDLQAGDQFGASVAYMEIDGERTVAVGAPMSDRMWTDGAIAEDLENAGKAYLFNYDTDEFNLSSILSGDSDADDHFGYALGFDNLGRCIVGAPSDETDGSDEGLLYVYGLFDSTPPAVDVLDIPDYVTCEDGDAGLHHQHVKRRIGVHYQQLVHPVYGVECFKRWLCGYCGFFTARCL